LQRSIIEQKLHPIRFRSPVVLGLRQGQREVQLFGRAMEAPHSATATNERSNSNSIMTIDPI
jgi:hypothetical protein